jgi:methanogenic corrinoid protein MtbC1
MIRWCSYCQRFLGEKPPFDDPEFTHGICDECRDRLMRDEPIKSETEPIRELMRRILISATRGDEQDCAAVIERAGGVGLKTEQLLVGLLQPALYQAGLDWQGARMSVAAEHQLTSWCERVFLLLPAAPMPSGGLDLLIFQTPGNAHDIGPRFAARSLAARGLQVLAFVPSLPLEEMVAQARYFRPKVIGFSCALPASVSVALELIARIREALAPELAPRFVLSGFAFRMGGAPAAALEAGVEVLIDLESFHV